MSAFPFSEDINIKNEFSHRWNLKIDIHKSLLSSFFYPLYLPDAAICKLKAIEYQNWIQRPFKPAKWYILHFSESPFWSTLPTHATIWNLGANHHQKCVQRLFNPMKRHPDCILLNVCVASSLRYHNFEFTAEPIWKSNSMVLKLL